MFNYLQKIGKALMVPVAVLPAAAIMLGIGYWIDPTGWGANSQLAAFLIKAGAAIIDNMPILFAVGVAFGLSKDKHGAAALTGLVAFEVVTTLLSTGAIAQITGTPIEEVPAAFGKISCYYSCIFHTNLYLASSFLCSSKFWNSSCKIRSCWSWNLWFLQ